MIRRVDLSYSRAARLGAAVLLATVVSLGLAAAPAQAGGRGKYRAWRNRAVQTRLAYAPVYRTPLVTRTAFVPVRTSRVYYTSTPFVTRTYPVYRTVRYYRTSPVYYRTAPVYYRSSRYVGYPRYSTSFASYPRYYSSYPRYYSSYGGVPLYRERRSVARDILTVAATTGAGAVVGGLLGGKRGAVIGAIAGGIGGAALTRVRGDRYRYYY